MTKLLERKRQLVLETPYLIRRRALVVHIEPSGLGLREKGRRFRLDISWADIHHRAAEIAAEELHRERLMRRTNRGKQR